MKNYIFLIFIVFISNYSFSQSNQDIKATEISFLFVHSEVAGTLTGFSSSSAIDVNNFENSKLEGAVAVSTIKTGNSFRDWHLKRRKYFDADTYPKITFKSQEIKKNNNTYSVLGELTIKGIAKLITIDFVKNNTALIGTSRIYSSDFGIDIKGDRSKNEVLMKLILRIND